MRCDRVKEALPSVLHGEGSARTRERVEDHLATCDGCRAERASLEADLARLRAAVAPAATPMPSGDRLAARVLADLDADRGAARETDRNTDEPTWTPLTPPWRVTWARGAALAAVAAALVAAVLALRPPEEHELRAVPVAKAPPTEAPVEWDDHDDSAPETDYASTLDASTRWASLGEPPRELDAEEWHAVLDALTAELGTPDPSFVERYGRQHEAALEAPLALS